MINCMCQFGPWGTRIFGKTVFWMFTWGCFWRRLTFQPVDRLRQTASLRSWASSNQLKAWREKKKADPLPSKGNSLLPDCLWDTALAFSYSRIQTEIMALPGVLSLLDSGPKLHQQLSWVSSLQLGYSLWGTWDLSGFIMKWAIFNNKSHFLSQYIYMILKNPN